ncbi:MAG TPA: hypothetical protein VHZ53_06695 [Steroidobacteraceae bacterium]|nr:hypothetical protein [Steroidobacteraceae bacterium]
MNRATWMRRSAIVAAAAVAIGVVACGGSSLSGTYLPKGGGMGNGLVMDKLEFGSGHSVTLDMMQQRIRASYKIDGKQVVLAGPNGQQLVFDIDKDGCLDGGGLYGKFCKA